MCEGGLAVASTGMTNAGDDSDYYTPEDPATTILSPLHTDKVYSPRYLNICTHVYTAVSN